MRRSSYSPEPDCAIAHSLGVVGDGWDLLVIRDLARGVDRFDALAGSLHISRKVLTERLNGLVDHGVVSRAPYQDRPVRHRYLLTERGRALLPVLVALQDWGDRWLLGDGALTGADATDAPSSHRLHALVGTTIPVGLLLPATSGGTRDVVAVRGPTVLFGYPATGRPSPLPEGWGDIPGAHGCTLENRLFRERYDEFVAAGINVHGVSTQRPDEQRGFAELEAIPHVLLSDTGRRLTAALRLPTFRAGDVERLKRFVLVTGPDRVVQAVRYPVTDLPAAVNWSLRTAATLP
ncbi:MAG: winged helix-turn-helix transcriptional regulator [Kribbellaceae bacterium]